MRSVRLERSQGWEQGEEGTGQAKAGDRGMEFAFSLMQEREGD